MTNRSHASSRARASKDSATLPSWKARAPGGTERADSDVDLYLLVSDEALADARRSGRLSRDTEDNELVWLTGALPPEYS